jgi:hypothetical protein
MPSFETMSRAELKAYIRQHPTDNAAIRELFVHRCNPDAKQYPYPYDMPTQDVEVIFREKINQVNQDN